MHLQLILGKRLLKIFFGKQEDGGGVFMGGLMLLSSLT